MPIGRREWKVVCLAGLAGGWESCRGVWTGFCGGAAVRYWKHGGLDAVMRGRRRRSPEGGSNVKDARVTVVRYSLSLELHSEPLHRADRGAVGDVRARVDPPEQAGVESVYWSGSSGFGRQALAGSGFWVLGAGKPFNRLR